MFNKLLLGGAHKSNCHFKHRARNLLLAALYKYLSNAEYLPLRRNIPLSKGTAYFIYAF